jgi:hypothetical protein
MASGGLFLFEYRLDSLHGFVDAVGVVSDLTPTHVVATIDRAIEGLFHRLDIHAAATLFRGRFEEELVPEGIVPSGTLHE